jgi:hypothetical protein
MPLPIQEIVLPLDAELSIALSLQRRTQAKKTGKVKDSKYSFGLMPNACNQRLATLDLPHRPILSRVRCIAWLELRCQHRQANASLDPHSGKVMSSPAAINGIRHYAGRSGRAPGRSNNCENLSGLGDKASDSKAQEKSAIGRTELRHTQRPIRLNTKNTARGFGK